MDSFINRVGGKMTLRDEIINRFPKGFTRYVEVFGGAGWVLFKKNSHAEIEVFNDIDGQLINLFRVVKYHEGELLRQIQYFLSSREIFEDMKAMKEMRGLTDIQRAAQYYLLIRLSYGAKTDTFGQCTYNHENLFKRITEAHKRLEKVVIEHLDFERLIKVYDRSETLFYCDPPYFKSEGYYDNSFDVADHERLKEALKNIKGKFILSYNDVSFIRELYKDYHIEAIERANNLSGTGARYKEIIVKNF